MTEKEYRELPNSEYFSASFLKMFNKEGPNGLINKPIYKNKELLKGSIIDSLAFDNDNFENIYYISTADKEPTYTDIKLIDKLSLILDSDKDIKKDNYKDIALKIIKELKLWYNIKNESILIDKVTNSDFIKNLRSKIKSKDKIVISGNDYMNALEVVDNLKKNEFTKIYFDNSDIKNSQVLFQIPIIFNIKNDKFKCLLDIIHIDHKNKQIKAVDLKTGFDDNNSFKWSFLKWRYDIQAALYTKSLEHYISKNGLSDYRIVNPVFIYTQVSKPDRPLPFEISSSIIKGAFKGFVTNSNYEYKGILELVEEIKWHRKTKIYNYSKGQYEKKGLSLREDDLNVRYYNDSLRSNFFNNYTNNRLTELQNSYESTTDRLQGLLENELAFRTMPPRRTNRVRSSNESVTFNEATAIVPDNPFE